MRLIIMAAGQGYKLDGFNKLLLRDARDGQTVLDKYLQAFRGKDVTVVTGYRAINIMHQYHDLQYIHNPEWAVSNNSHSLSLVITDEPCYVISDDFFIEPGLIEYLDGAGPDLVLTEIRENRILTALNCICDESRTVQEVYQGKLRSQSDPEMIGIYKISDPQILQGWRKNCIEYPNLFVGQNLPMDPARPISAVDLGPHRFVEINTPLDYIRLLHDEKGPAGSQ